MFALSCALGWEDSPLGFKSQPWALHVKQGEHIAPILHKSLDTMASLVDRIRRKVESIRYLCFVSYRRCKCDSVH